MLASSFKVTVTFEAREDGGVRAYSDDVPGLILSSRDISGLVDDIPTVLGVCLSKQFDAPIKVEPLGDYRQMIKDRFAMPVSPTPGPKEFVARFA